MCAWPLAAAILPVRYRIRLQTFARGNYEIFSYLIKMEECMVRFSVMEMCYKCCRPAAVGSSRQRRRTYFTGKLIPNSAWTEWWTTASNLLNWTSKSTLIVRICSALRFLCIQSTVHFINLCEQNECVCAAFCRLSAFSWGTYRKCNLPKNARDVHRCSVACL